MIKIYAITSSKDPDNIVYVGKTIKKLLSARLSQHIYDAKKAKRKNKMQAWIINQINNNYNINIELIDNVEKDNWAFWEKHYISLYKSWGFNLKNMTIGGENGVIRHTPESKKLISLNKKGKKLNLSIERRLYILDWAKRKMSEKNKQLLRERNKSVKSIEHMRNISKFREKKILCIDKNNNVLYFDSIKKASDFLVKKHNITLQTAQPAICVVLKGKRKTYKKYYWKYQTIK